MLIKAVIRPEFQGGLVMADENNHNDEGSGLRRRDFLKSSGVVVAGGTLGAGLTFPAETAGAAEAAPATITNFRCPIDAKDFNTFAELRSHFASAHPGAVVPVTTKLKVNGKDCEVLIEPHWTLQRTLQFKLGLTGAKQMCDRGVCGSCTVIIDGRAVLSCTTLAVECEGKSIETVEGIAADPKWRPLIQSYCKWDAMQCGYCTPGFVVSAKALLDKNPNPTEEDCRQALAGNICCCGTYPRHPTAIVEAAQAIRGGA
jgi:aerobic-type carbon monoxide dehydrogenase small subunit (CoxS/CutS family)